ncbi:hypothetical protein BX616_007413 [Lobosporangium transversale]|uniref:Uncharacterized protein n=1 Tax=Lobosporangium transversale TaxID=64571 RepID=A0A1Y2GTB7_9FUNG|nr:hypothetical protein BCR41DRAFT_395724 [Lobosporangium transversale]KAF9896460.1 hypothetical protein BX616_007413 [Lobosporangium transversale]ORZ17443.1 hypothetical protein BCR41DRAFT_395724 [Lobosporangium transversale]|eukprot:XP_021881830.1 hypothetical protein BCR41DRAFT_395724 [Lobosporangium transversale]
MPSRPPIITTTSSSSSLLSSPSFSTISTTSISIMTTKKTISIRSTITLACIALLSVTFASTFANASPVDNRKHLLDAHKNLSSPKNSVDIPAFKISDPNSVLASAPQQAIHSQNKELHQHEDIDTILSDFLDLKDNDKKDGSNSKDVLSKTPNILPSVVVQTHPLIKRKGSSGGRGGGGRSGGGRGGSSDSSKPKTGVVAGVHTGARGGSGSGSSAAPIQKVSTSLATILIVISVFTSILC